VPDELIRLRVMILILITRYGGEEMAHGIFHDVTGVLSFLIALLILGVIDKGFSMFSDSTKVEKMKGAV
jgi:hypothetical protein